MKNTAISNPHNDLTLSGRQSSTLMAAPGNVNDLAVLGIIVGPGQRYSDNSESGIREARPVGHINSNPNPLQKLLKHIGQAFSFRFCPPGKMDDDSSTRSTSSSSGFDSVRGASVRLEFDEGYEGDMDICKIGHCRSADDDSTLQLSPASSADTEMTLDFERAERDIYDNWYIPPTTSDELDL